MNNTFTIEGRVQITQVPGDELLDCLSMERAIRDGLAVRLVDTTNMLVNIGLEAIMALFGGGNGSPSVNGNTYTPSTVLDVSGYRMKLGTSLAITKPVPGDTNLQGSLVYSFDIGTAGVPDVSDGLLVVTYPALGKVKFSGIIPKPEQNGKTFTEEGLFGKDFTTPGTDPMLARTTFSADKTSAGGLQFEHTFTLTRKP